MSQQAARGEELEVGQVSGGRDHHVALEHGAVIQHDLRLRAAAADLRAPCRYEGSPAREQRSREPPRDPGRGAAAWVAPRDEGDGAACPDRPGDLHAQGAAADHDDRGASLEPSAQQPHVVEAAQRRLFRRLGPAARPGGTSFRARDPVAMTRPSHGSSRRRRVARRSCRGRPGPPACRAARWPRGWTPAARVRRGRRSAGLPSTARVGCRVREARRRRW